MQAVRQHRKVVEITHPNDAKVAPRSLQESADAQEVVYTCRRPERKDVAFETLDIPVFDAPQGNDGFVKIQGAQRKLLVSGLQVHCSDPQIRWHSQPLRMDTTIQDRPIRQGERNMTPRPVETHQENRRPDQVIQSIQGRPLRALKGVIDPIFTQIINWAKLVLLDHREPPDRQPPPIVALIHFGRTVRTLKPRLLFCLGDSDVVKCT